MIVENPEVTLAEDGHDFPEEATERAHNLWAMLVNAQGDDGRQYWIDCSIVRFLNMASLFPSAGTSATPQAGGTSSRPGQRCRARATHSRRR